MQRTGTQVAIEPWFAHCRYHSIGGAEASVVMSTASSDTVGGVLLFDKCDLPVIWVQFCTWPCSIVLGDSGLAIYSTEKQQPFQRSPFQKALWLVWDNISCWEVRSPVTNYLSALALASERWKTTEMGTPELSPLTSTPHRHFWVT